MEIELEKYTADDRFSSLFDWGLYFLLTLWNHFPLIKYLSLLCYMVFDKSVIFLSDTGLPVAQIIAMTVLYFLMLFRRWRSMDYWILIKSKVLFIIIFWIDDL